MKKIFLKAGKEDPVRRFHPWIFSGAVARQEEGIQPGDWVAVYDVRERRIASGHYQEGSIRTRILEFSSVEPMADFYYNKFLKAYALRQALLLGRNGQTTCFRLVHGEGDGLPGLVVDIYGDTAVVQCHAPGMWSDKNRIIEALIRIPNLPIARIFDKSEETLYKTRGMADRNSYWHGEKPSQPECFENGHRFLLDWEKGQKTGFFLDQRENRFLLGQLAAGKHILNAYSYTGGFTIYAIKGGAETVHSVDASSTAITLLKDNLECNGAEPERHQAFVEDVPTFLRQGENLYDVVVIDPPAFAKSLEKRHSSIQAYIRLNAQALRRVKPGGLLFTFSCSQVVERHHFQNALLAACREAGRDGRVLYQLTQGPDHPGSIFHPEGSYLKGLVLFVS